MKRADLWMPFYVGDYLADTMHLTRDQHGGYLLLIMAYWRNGGPLPDDDELLRGITKSTKFIWKSLRPILVNFFTINSGLWHHKRIDAEILEARNRSDIRSAAGKTGAQARWQTHGKRMRSPMRSDSKHNTTHISPNGENARGARSSLAEDFAAFWSTYPHPVGKGAAETKFRIARKMATQAELLDAVGRYKRTKPEDRPWCNPATWLHQQRWLDQPDLPLANGHDDRPPPAPLDPRKLGHSLPCACNNCTRWVALHAREA